MERAHDAMDKRRSSDPLVLLTSIARMKFNAMTKDVRKDATESFASMKNVKQSMQKVANAKAKAAKRARKRAQLDDPNWNVIRAKAAEQLLHDELIKLMKDINHLIRAEHKNMPAWIRKYKDEDPRCVFYHSMLRRVGLPERHARYAPWFLKSEQLKLNKYGQRLFKKFEAAYLNREEALGETESAVTKHVEYAARLQDIQADPKDKNQALVQRAFRDCSFKVKHIEFNNKGIKSNTHPILLHAGSSEDDPEAVAHPERLDSEDPLVVILQIPEVPKAPAPPGLAPQVPGKLESHGKHNYYNYNGRWKNGEMRGAVGVYTFADGGKYVGAWKDSRQCGPGSAEYPNGTKYHGNWKDGKYHGIGTWEAKDGTKYEGMWKDGLREGKGKLTLPSGATYEGEFYKNLKHGVGVECSPLGHKYKGNFRMNRIYGEGQVEIDLENGQTHIYPKENWAPCLLGEAAAEARLHMSGVDMETEMKMRRLLRVRDDLRALDLQLEYREKEANRILEEKQRAKEERRNANRARREAEAAAKQALVGELAKEMSEDSEEEVKPNFHRGDDEGSSEEEGDEIPQEKSNESNEEDEEDDDEEES